MMLTAARMRQIGWGVLLGACLLAFLILSITVHAVNSEVMRKERQIIAFKQEIQLLETEFQSRANQRQLANWNRLELGYEAPRADQYIDNRRALAALGQPSRPGAPSPVRVARAEPLTGAEALAAERSSRDMVSPVTGAPVTLASAMQEPSAISDFTAAFESFLLESSQIPEAKAQTLDVRPARAGFAQASIATDQTE